MGKEEVIMLSPLIIQEEENPLPECADVPDSVKQLLKRDWNEQNKIDPISVSGEPETILYCSPPIDNTIKDPYAIPILCIAAGNLMIGVSFVALMADNLPFAVIFAFLTLPITIVPIIIAFYIIVRNRFGYYVVTNYRAAIVVPERHYLIYGIAVANYFFKKTFDENIKNGSKTGLCNMTQRSANSAVADFNFGNVLTFYNPPRLQELENIIIHIVTRLMESKEAQSLQFETKTNDVANAQTAHCLALVGIFFPLVVGLGVFAAWIAFIYDGVTNGNWFGILIAFMLSSLLFWCPAMWQASKVSQESYEAAAQGRSFDYCKRTDLSEQEQKETKHRKSGPFDA